MIAVVTGGSGSGKSAYAESLMVGLNALPRYYVATMQPFGKEDYERIQRHREMRNAKQFVTIECPRSIHEIQLPEGSSVLLECMSNLLANEMYGGNVDHIMIGINRLINQCKHLIIVTNEVFSDGIKYASETEQYIRKLGDINRKIADQADYFCEVVYGIPYVLKGSVI